MNREAFIRSGLERGILLLCGLALVLDLPLENPFGGHLALTETIGEYFFGSLRSLTPLPLPASVFELCSYTAFAFVLLLWGRQRARFWLLALASGGAVLASCGLALVLGGLRGQSIALGLTQLHFVPLLACWLGLGYFLGTQSGIRGRLLAILYYSILVKSLYALFVFWTVFGGQMGEREYLIDHSSSIALAYGLGYAVSQLLLWRQSLSARLGYMLSLLPLGWVYILNDRRASFAGLMALALLLPWMLPRGLKLRLWPYIKVSAVMGTLALVAAALVSSNPYGFAGGLRGEFFTPSAPSYRQMENFNLLQGVIEAPVLGIGLGRGFPQTIELPDVSMVFPLFAALPHNTLYFLWTFAGPMGIATLFALSWTSLMLVIRTGAWSRSASELIFASLTALVLCQWLMFVTFDMGLFGARGHLMLGVLLGQAFPLYARMLKEYAHETAPTSAASASRPAPDSVRIARHSGRQGS